MNRTILLLILLTYSFSLFAKEDAVIILQDFAPRGEKGKREVVIAGKDFLMVNAEKLSSAEIITQSQHIKKISEFKTSSGVIACKAGRFEHILKKGKLEKRETGCLESDRYLELSASFKALAKDHLTEKN